MQIVKTDPSGTVQIAGAVFAVHLNTADGQFVGTVTTDAHGVATVGGLVPGTLVCIVETAAPPGYQLAPQYVPAQCAQASSATPPVVSVADPPNAATATGELRVTKTDPVGHTVTVAGAAFAIHEGAVDGPIAASIATDQSGSATAGGLAPGTYCVVETAAPQGFRLQPAYAPGQCVSVAADPTQGGSPTTVTVADPAAPSPTGELLVVKTDPSGRTVSAPGFSFDIHVGSASGPLAAAVTTDGSGTAVAAALNPATYCVEETATPDGWQLQPTYSPGQCVAVRADATQGRNPITVTVVDPPTASASPAGAADTGSQRQPPGPAAAGAGVQVAEIRAPGYRPLAIGLVSFGIVLLAAGAAMIVVGLRRRRLQGPEPPSDTWYDSTVG